MQNLSVERQSASQTISAPEQGNELKLAGYRQWHRTGGQRDFPGDLDSIHATFANDVV